MYLPKGEWTDAWSGETYEGPTEVAIQTPRHKIPILIKSDSEVNLGNLEDIYQKSLEIAQQKPDLQKLLKSEDFSE